MIYLTHLDGRAFALNADLIERVESTVDRAGAVVTLVDGAVYGVRETLLDVMTAVHELRASLVARSGAIESELPVPGLRVVSNLEGR